MVKQGVVKDAVFTLALDRVPQGTSVMAPAGMMALGGLVSSSYYVEPFTSVPIEVTTSAPAGGQLTWYTTTHELLYGLANGTVVSGGTYQSIVDSGTAPNFIPSPAAAELNAQFVPPGVYNQTLGYWVVDCNAKAPYAAYKIGGKVMPMDPQDMIVRSLNGLPGYENVCFSAFGDGGDPTTDVMIIGEVWQRSYVVAYDQGQKMLHFADRKPY
jgi:aspergillopepsin I